MTDKPILFSGPMVRAILDGRKTQTRRVLKPHRKFPHYNKLRFDVNWAVPGEVWWWDGVHDRVGASMKLPYQPGDRLWVRETWKPHSIYAPMTPSEVPENSKIFYRADDTYSPSNIGWASPTHMPRRFSRLTLYVTAVKVERLQEIDGYDAYWEGVCKSKEGHDAGHPSYTIMEFERLWDTINAKRDGCTWDDNPWIVAVTFEARQGNIDSLPLELAA